MSAIYFNTSIKYDYSYNDEQSQNDRPHAAGNHPGYFESEPNNKAEYSNNGQYFKISSMSNEMRNHTNHQDTSYSSMNPKVTHRGFHKFVSRHADEISIDIGHRVQVFGQEDNSWYYGYNFDTQQTGYFPSIYVCDADTSPTDGDNITKSLKNAEKNQFPLIFMGSIQVVKNKGDEVILESIEKVLKVSSFKKDWESYNCLFEVSDFELRFFESSEKHGVQSMSEPKSSYFFCFKNVTFYGNHENYFAFISKHPTLPLFACHVFKVDNCSQIKTIMDSIGQAFYKFYQNLIDLSQTLLE